MIFLTCVLIILFTLVVAAVCSLRRGKPANQVERNFNIKSCSSKTTRVKGIRELKTSCFKEVIRAVASLSYYVSAKVLFLSQFAVSN